MQQTGIMLKLRRTLKGATARDIARELGLTPGRISQIESEADVSDADAARYLAALARCEPDTAAGETALERCAAAKSELGPKIAGWRSSLDQVKAGMLELRSDWEKHRPTRDWEALEPFLTRWAELMVQFNAVVSDVDRSCQKAADLVVLQRLLTEALVPTSAALDDFEDWPCSPVTRFVPRERANVQHDQYAPQIRRLLEEKAPEEKAEP